MDKILITGVNGFIGSHLTDFLISKNFDIYGLDIPGKPFNNLKQYIDRDLSLSNETKVEIFKNCVQIPTYIHNLTLIECDLKNSSLLDEIISKIKPKYIFHFGAQPSIIRSWEDPIDTIETNVIGTINIFEPVKKYEIKTRVIIASTSTEFGTTTKINRPLKENDPLLAVHPYGISKIAAELLARQYYINFGIEIINLRFFNQIGPRKSYGAAADFIRKIAQIDLGILDPIIEVGDLDTYRDFTGIKDTIQAIWLATIQGKAGETYHVCSNNKTQIRQLLEIALSFSKKEIKIIENVSYKLRQYDENIIIGDNSKIKNELGFKITQSVEDVLKDIYDYWTEFYKRNKELSKRKN